MAGKKRIAGKTRNEKKQPHKYALLSVSDKTGIVDLAKILLEQQYKIISTGGTAKQLAQNNIPVVPIELVTGNPESFEGRMKTISFQIESAILYDRTKESHVKEANELGIKNIDVVVCNLYPFEKTTQENDVTLDDAVEQIDVGGPTMARAAAKNFKNVLVVVDPSDYEAVGTAIRNKSVTFAMRKALAAKAFHHLSFYDAQIASFLSDELFPKEITLPGRKILDLRYGENPHQQAALYLSPNNNSPFQHLKKLWGRDLSLTNVSDINAGLEAVRQFADPAAVIIKHNSPCGIAIGETIADALNFAIQADPESAFGGVIVLNKPLDMRTAKIIASFKDQKKGNMDIIAVPHIDLEELSYLQSIRKSMGIYTFGKLPRERKDAMNIKWVDGGFLLQTGENDSENSFKSWEVVTAKKPSPKQLDHMKIGWKFITKIRSNAVIVIDKKIPMTRGIGSGQTSRLRSTKIALSQAGKFTNGAILISDSFFPFDDSVKLASKHGISVILQQGGSINDKLSVEAANKAGIAMVFTHTRAFWH